MKRKLGWMEERKKEDRWKNRKKKLANWKVEKNKLIIINSIDFSELSV